MRAEHRVSMRSWIISHDTLSAQYLVVRLLCYEVVMCLWQMSLWPTAFSLARSDYLKKEACLQAPAVNLTLKGLSNLLLTKEFVNCVP